MMNRSRKSLKAFGAFAAGAWLWSAAAVSEAATISLRWEANTESDLAGYRLFQHTESLLGRTPDEALSDSSITKITYSPGTHNATISNLAMGASYYFRLTAYNTSNRQSPFNVDGAGNPVQVVIFIRPESTQPDVTAVSVAEASFHSAVLEWTTDQPATSQVEYGTSPAYGRASPASSTLATRHRISLENLSVGTVYYFRVKSANAAGRTTMSGGLTFKTAALPSMTYAAAPQTGPVYLSGDLMSVQMTASAEAGEGAFNPVQDFAVTLHYAVDQGPWVSRALTQTEPGLFAGYIDTRGLETAKIRYYCEGSHRATTAKTRTAEQTISLAPELVLRPSGGARYPQEMVFEAPDGNPANGNLSVRLPAGQSVSTLSFRRRTASQVPAAPPGAGAEASFQVVGAYDVFVPGSASVRFNKPVTLTLVYPDLDGPDINGDGLPDGDGFVDSFNDVKEKDLSIWWLDGHAWKPIGGQVNTEKNAVTAVVSRLSTFAVMSRRAPSAARAPQKFLSPALADGINDTATFGLEASEVTILDVRGQRVFEATAADWKDSSITWTCRNEQGDLVPSGVYIAKIKKKDGSTVYQKLAVVK
jgi:hypothetical protein